MFAKKLLGPAVGVALAFGSASALGAAPVVTAFINGQNNLSDDSGEIVVISGPGDTIGLGSVYIGVVGITSYPSSGVPVGSVNELTGVFALEVTAIGPAGSSGACFLTAFMCNDVAYGPVADFNAAMASVGIGPFTKLDGITPLDAVGNPGTVAVIFEDPAQDFDRDGTDPDGAGPLTALDGAFLSAIGGTQVLTLVASGPTDLVGNAPATLTDLAGLIALGGPGTGVGSFSGTFTVQEEGFVGANIGPVFTISTGGQSAPTVGSAFIGIGVHNDATFVIDVTLVPEPGMLGLLGLGLLGLGAGSRRRRRPVA